MLWCGKLGRTQAEIVITINPSVVSLDISPYRGSQHAPSEPDCVSLHLVLDNLNLDWFGLKKKLLEIVPIFSLPPYLLSGQLLRCIQSVVDELLHVPLQSPPEVLEQVNLSQWTVLFTVGIMSP